MLFGGASVLDCCEDTDQQFTATLLPFAQLVGKFAGYPASTIVIAWVSSFPERREETFVNALSAF